jgi:hypothetical protein
VTDWLFHVTSLDDGLKTPTSDYPLLYRPAGQRMGTLDTGLPYCRQLRRAAPLAQKLRCGSPHIFALLASIGFVVRWPCQFAAVRERSDRYLVGDCT